MLDAHRGENWTVIAKAPGFPVTTGILREGASRIFSELLPVLAALRQHGKSSRTAGVYLMRNNPLSYLSSPHIYAIGKSLLCSNKVGRA